jgi:dihydroorotase
MVQAGQIALPDLLASLSTRPAGLLGLGCGRLVPGAPGDLMLLDIDAPYVVDKRKLKSRAKNSPFDEARLEGIVQATFVGGRMVYEAPAA